MYKSKLPNFLSSYDADANSYVKGNSAYLTKGKPVLSEFIDFTYINLGQEIHIISNKIFDGIVQSDKGR